MINASQIKEHMEVKGSDGKHVGTVLGVEGGQMKVASGGMDHYIDIDAVDAVQGDNSEQNCRRDRADVALDAAMPAHQQAAIVGLPIDRAADECPAH